MEKLTCEVALRFIANAEAAEQFILGINGYEAHPEGHEARLDLILDTSLNPSLSNSQRAELARAFVREKDGPNIFFEVCIED